METGGRWLLSVMAEPQYQVECVRQNFPRKILGKVIKGPPFTAGECGKIVVKNKEALDKIHIVRYG